MPGRPLALDMGAVLNAILHVERSGCQWQHMPKDFPNHHSVYYHYRRWRQDGTWRRLTDTLCHAERARHSRVEAPSTAIIDCRSVNTTAASGVRGYDAGRLVRGRKRHIVVDILSNLLATEEHAANVQDLVGDSRVGSWFYKDVLHLGRRANY